MDSFWMKEVEEVARELEADPQKGLSEEAARAKLAKYGRNSLEDKKKTSAIRVLLNQFTSPVNLILIFATVISLFLQDYTDAIIIFAIILFSGLLSFRQEYNAGNAVAELLKIVSVKAEVLRNGKAVELSVEEVVPGDVVKLSTGDIIPADGLLIESNDLNIDESTLTGETFPVEKKMGVLPADTPLARRENSLWMGTHVASGSGKLLIVQTGRNTEFGRISQSVKEKAEPNEFERGVSKFGILLMKLTSIIMVSIFLINVILKKPIFDSFMFSLALAVGLTPQLLPAIISINLSHGAKAMAKKKVIVKKLNSIENFGSMEVLCTDKTGTITRGEIDLQGILNSAGNAAPELFPLAFLNARLQLGFANSIDQGIIEYASKNQIAVPVDSIRVLDEQPYNFIDRRLSVAVDLGSDTLQGESRLIITKGAVANVLAICDRVLLENGEIRNLRDLEEGIMEKFQSFSHEGFRTLGLAYKPVDGEVVFDEKMIFAGFITMADPLKDGMKEIIQELNELHVELKIITGDNLYVAKHIARELGVDEKKVLTGKEVEGLSLDELAEVTRESFLFAETEPNQKEKIIEAVKRSGRVVGYMGDGINDTPALQKADVSISVDSAADIAKDVASIVLLEPELKVLVDGIAAGRKTFANTMKYVYMASSANFGNMFSMAGASLFLPFLPLLPKQVLLTNLLTDLPEMQIATDKVDEEQLKVSHRWNIGFIRKFMMVFGFLSSLFDYITFGVLYFVLHAGADLFRTAWFVESVISACSIVLVLRTRKRFYRDQPNPRLLAATILVILVTLYLPYSPLAGLLGFTALPVQFLLILAGIVIVYITLAEIAKELFFPRRSMNGNH